MMPVIFYTMKHWFIITICIFGVIVSCAAIENNVCKTFKDYYSFRNFNKNCYFNPDAVSAELDIIRRHGYPLETYPVTTEDGYILTIFRIPHGKNAKGVLPGTPIFVQHGLMSSSITYFFRGNTSLAFNLADAGYDVWLGNFRGVRHSNKNLKYNDNQRQFWNFSFHELGVYDMPAQLNFVKNFTNKRLLYLGYSMGTTVFFIYSSLFPEEAASTIRLSISLAPVAFMNHVKTPARYLLLFWPVAQFLFDSVAHGSIGQRTFLFRALITILCLPLPFQMKFCNLFLFLLFGFDYPQLDPEIEPIAFTQLIDAASVKTITHYIQLMQSGGFRYFDYGKQNINVYGTTKPPSYPLRKIKVPNLFIRGPNDFLSTKPDVEELYAVLPKVAKPFPIYPVNYSRFNHGDFFKAKDVKKFVYDYVIQFLNEYSSQFP